MTMKKTLCIPVLSSVLFTSALCFSLRGEIYFYSEAEFGRWVSSYYKDSDEKNLSRAMKFYCNSYLYEMERTREPMAHFFAAILREDPHLMKEVYRQISQSGSLETKEFFINVFWLIDNTDAQKIIFQAYEKWKEDRIHFLIERIRLLRPKNIYLGEVKNLATIQKLWAEFLGSGSDEPVIHIISALKKDDEENETKEKNYVSELAEDSLLAFSITHSRVLGICRKQADVIDKEKAIILRNIILKVNQQELTGIDETFNIFMYFNTVN